MTIPDLNLDLAGATPPRLIPPRPPSRVHMDGPGVSGATALILILIAGSVVLLAWWAGRPTQTADGHRTIQGFFGFVVAALISIAILGHGWLYKIKSSLARPYSPYRRAIEFLFGWLGWLLSAFDRVLALRVASICGGMIARAHWRYLHFIIYFSAAAMASWMLPPPIGLSGVFAALLGALALNRKWQWLEDDRRNYVITGHYDVSADSNMSLGFEADFRDVAMTALVVLSLLMPAALRQASGLGVFDTADGSPISALPWWEWYSFFGGEMAKSVPFVDWSEVYGAETVTPIVVQAGGGQHVVFAVRVLVDLVLLAGLLQAIEVSTRLARQRANFIDDTYPERILDPFLERDAFADLATRAAPDDPSELDLKIIDKVPTLIKPEGRGGFANYSTYQLQRILASGEAPDPWWPNHATAAALIVPHRPNQNKLPIYFTRLFRGEHDESYRRWNSSDEPTHWRTNVAAILAVLSKAQLTGAQDVVENSRRAIAVLPKFLNATDPWVWSSTASALAALAHHPEFPTSAWIDFRATLAPKFAEENPDRTRLYHKALTHLANAKLDDGSHLHRAASTEIMIEQISVPDLDPHLLRSAVEAMAAIADAEGETAERLANALHRLAEDLTPAPRSVRKVMPWLATNRVRKRTLEVAAGLTNMGRE